MGESELAEIELPNDLGWQLRLATGQVVNVYDSGSVVVQGVGREPVQRLLNRLLTSTSTFSERPKAPADTGLGADGRPIPLPGTDVVLAMGAPRPPKVYENPKTVRHMENRLRSLRFRVCSAKRLSSKEWEFRLDDNLTLYFEESGKISLPTSQRDYRLRKLFRIEPPQDQVARNPWV